MSCGTAFQWTLIDLVARQDQKIVLHLGSVFVVGERHSAAIDVVTPGTGCFSLSQEGQGERLGPN